MMAKSMAKEDRNPSVRLDDDKLTRARAAMRLMGVVLLGEAGIAERPDACLSVRVAQPSRRPFRDQPIQKTRQHRRFAGVEGNEGDIARSRDLDSRKRRQKSPSRNIRL
jgi:hypothetical protein